MNGPLAPSCLDILLKLVSEDAGHHCQSCPAEVHAGIEALRGLVADHTNSGIGVADRPPSQNVKRKGSKYYRQTRNARKRIKYYERKVARQSQVSTHEKSVGTEEVSDNIQVQRPAVQASEVRSLGHEMENMQLGEAEVRSLGDKMKDMDLDAPPVGCLLNKISLTKFELSL